MTTIAIPDTIFSWHRELVTQKWDYSDRRKRNQVDLRSRTSLKQLVLRFTKENPDWGYDGIQGAFANLGHEVCDPIVGNILQAHGIEPAPERKRQTTWMTFLKADWDVLGAIDFIEIEVWTQGELVTFYLLFVMELKTHRVHFAVCTPNPAETWMKQIARNLIDGEDGFLNGKRYLLMDCDTKLCLAFWEIIKNEGTKLGRLPPKSPNWNAHLERYFRSLKEEFLEHLIVFGESSLRNAVNQCVDHYHAERNHQGLRYTIIEPGDEVGTATGKIECRDPTARTQHHHADACRG